MGSSENKQAPLGSRASKDLPPNPAPFFPTIFFNNQFCAKPVYPPTGTDLSGKTAIVTGANTGLGLECSRQLLSFKLSKLILAVRSTEKGDKAAAELQSRYPKADIDVWKLDMASYASIQDFVKRIESSLAQVDFVVLNAGIHNGAFKTVPATGHEEMFQVNYLSQVLLTFLLLPVLKAKSEASSSGPTHVTWVNSGLALAAKFSNRDERPLFPSLSKGAKGFDPDEAYSRTKLLAHYFLWKLVEYVSVDDVIVSLVDPGFVRGTSLTKTDHFNVVKKAVWPLMSRAGRTVEIGASTMVDAVVNKGREAHGSYLMSWEICPFATMAYGPDGVRTRERLWLETVEELKFADVDTILSAMKSSKESLAA